MTCLKVRASFVLLRWRRGSTYLARERVVIYGVCIYPSDAAEPRQVHLRVRVVEAAGDSDD